MPTAEARLPRTLRRMGYDVATLAMFRHPGLPDTLERVPLEAFTDNARAARKRGASCIVLVGTSRGGELALLLASVAPEAFDAYVSLVPSSVAGSAVKISPFNTPAWTWKGRDVPYMRLNRTSLNGVGWVLSRGERRAAYNLAMTRGAYDRLPPDHPSRIPIERIRRPVLMVSARRDQVWPSDRMARDVFDRAERSGTSELLGWARLDADHYIGDRADMLAAVVGFLERHVPRDARCGEHDRNR